MALLDFTIHLVYADTLKFFLNLYGHKLPAVAVCFSDDESVLVSGSTDKNLKIWSPHFGHCQKSVRAHEEGVTDVRFLQETHYALSCSKDRTCKMWDLDRYELVQSFQLAEMCCSLALATDGAIFFCAGEKGITKFVRTSEQLFVEEEREKELEERMDRMRSGMTLS